MPWSSAHSAAAVDWPRSVEGDQERIVLYVGERGLGRCGHEYGNLAAGGLQDRQGEVREGRTDEEVCSPVEQLLGRHTGGGGVAADVLDPDLDGRAVDAADAVDKVGEVRHQLGAGYVNEADHVAEVHGHADPDGLAGGRGSTVAQIRVQGRPDVDSLIDRLRSRHGLLHGRLRSGSSRVSLSLSGSGLSLSRFQLCLKRGDDRGVYGSLGLSHGGLERRLSVSCPGGGSFCLSRSRVGLSLSHIGLSLSLSRSRLSRSRLSRGSFCLSRGLRRPQPEPQPRRPRWCLGLRRRRHRHRRLQ